MLGDFHSSRKLATGDPKQGRIGCQGHLHHFRSPVFGSCRHGSHSGECSRVVSSDYVQWLDISIRFLGSGAYEVQSMAFSSPRKEQRGSQSSYLARSHNLNTWQSSPQCPLLCRKLHCHFIVLPTAMAKAKMTDSSLGCCRTGWIFSSTLRPKAQLRCPIDYEIARLAVC